MKEQKRKKKEMWEEKTEGEDENKEKEASEEKKKTESKALLIRSNPFLSLFTEYVCLHVCLSVFLFVSQLQK